MHLPVLYNESLEWIVTNPDGVYIDCTFGGGGHTRGILQKTADSSRVIGIDQDRRVLEVAVSDPRIHLIHGNFRLLEKLLASVNITRADGILLDLGVSSFQLDEDERGFSYQSDSRLDMRMNQEQDLSAWNVVNQYPAEELERILKVYGEEKYARSIARGIARAREIHAIDTTGELADVVKKNTPAAYHRTRHPARKTFQALRIEVNDELGSLADVLPQAVRLLAPDGRLGIITFHSLEDRLVKQFFEKEARNCICPPKQPVCTCGGQQARVRILTRKPVIPSEEEIGQNRRARSAKLRVVERTEF